eukprot:1326610-Amorphochlora_amoeboformis.AAC.1
MCLRPDDTCPGSPDTHLGPDDTHLGYETNPRNPARHVVRSPSGHVSAGLWVPVGSEGRRVVLRCDIPIGHVFEGHGG